MTEKYDLLTPAERATMDGNQQDEEWSNRWWTLSDEDRAAGMDAMIADGENEMRRELPRPELVLDKRYSAQSWLARFLATVTICGLPAPM